MSIQVICIGTELLTGETLNTNLAFIGERLVECGLQVAKEISIPDTPEHIVAALAVAIKECRLVITVGGLGPTADDLTRQTVARTLGRELEPRPEVADHIRALYRQRNIPGRDEYIRAQSMVPAGAELLPNDWGTAPGIWCVCGDCRVLMLPGPPRELRPMFTTYAIPKITAWLPPAVRTALFVVFGVPESIVEQRTLKALGQTFPMVEPAYCIGPGLCRVRLAAPAAQVAQLGEATRAVRAEFGQDVGEAQDDLPAAVAGLLEARGWRLATAESCTGGGIAAMLTDRAGISSVFVGGIVAYSNELKQQLLGVQAATLAAHGAVSAETATEMVTGLCARLNVQAGVAVTGIAGPTGGTPAKPVGTVYVATAVNGDVQMTAQAFPYDRAAVRLRTTVTALDQLRRHLLARPR